MKQNTLTPEQIVRLRRQAEDTIFTLRTDIGILASGRQEAYGCIFGRDTLLTCLMLLRTAELDPDAPKGVYHEIVAHCLMGLGLLLGKEENIESGEEPGKCIHEFRPKGHERLTESAHEPWYAYPDGVMRIYDTVDATPLFLLTLHHYAISNEKTEILDLMANEIRCALTWIIEWSDKNNDGLIDFQMNQNRKHGGLRTQNWMDSVDSMFHEDGTQVAYPIAPVEVQAYAYLALRCFESHFAKKDAAFGKRLSERADVLAASFHKHFIVQDGGKEKFAFAVDGNGKPMLSLRSSLGHLLWACRWPEMPNHCLLTDKQAEAVAKLMTSADLFEANAGIRTLSKVARVYRPGSYHNGSIWPHDNALIADGLYRYGYTEEAKKVATTVLGVIAHFGTPIELYAYDQKEGLSQFMGEDGQESCKQQAWSAAGAMLMASLLLKPTA